jgi:hypothetical protein
MIIITYKDKKYDQRQVQEFEDNGGEGYLSKKAESFLSDLIRFQVGSNIKVYTSKELEIKMKIDASEITSQKLATASDNPL